jgi:hypothetical protein
VVAISETGAPIAIRMRQNIGAALVGNLLEWYDFAVYGFMAAMIGKAFFPATDPLNSLLLSFAVFGVGFLGRPVLSRLVKFPSARVVFDSRGTPASYYKGLIQKLRPVSYIMGLLADSSDFAQPTHWPACSCHVYREWCWQVAV